MTSDPFLDQAWNTEDLEQALRGVGTIQEELNYNQARNSLGKLVDRLDLTSIEKIGLEAEIDRLVALLEKLDRSLIQIAAFGLVGRGKSSILNALVGQEIFTTGPLHGVTRTIKGVNWQLSSDDTFPNLARLTLNGQGNAQVQLLDTPGIDEVDGQTREILACQVAQQVDLILFIISGDMTKVEFSALAKLREAGKPMILVFNKIDQYPEVDRLAIYEKIASERVKELLSPDEIVMVAASPLLTETVKEQDGRLKTQRFRGKPQIEALKLKILEILEREGKSLVALNSMLYADEVNEQIVARKMAIRDRGANQLIQKAVMIKASAIALNPVTVLDLFTGAVIDLAMILALSRLYGIDLTRRGAIALLQKIALNMGGISASEFLAVLGLSSLKGLLGLSIPATGGISLLPYTSIALTQAGVAGVSCYAIGQVTKTYLANGATWGPDGPKAVVASILDSLDETSILNRIKRELGSKLGGGGLFSDQ
ncbi:MULTISPECIES: GTP-binding protein [unclassified Microcystis]|uniref:GTP-binding protein n=1 Tax=unclassified Microcystis TaxID=2643300 RepID=UPI0022BD51E3|nr:MULTISPECIES: GTP-binding protein [unclassified Microcystis]MCA2693630.1 GTP-binding protein [Microcystis sp. M034S2]MCA2752737.1 GTP-binding protein [Microcystis sp. M144S2]MCZ8200488.1 GTP-binding protein [Microcystis sp. LE19-55.1A]MCZ8308761.1 GTP-binding protein [Microcystis sp. LE19-98.1E]